MIEQITDPSIWTTSGEPRFVTMQAFGPATDLTRTLLQWQRPAELAATRFAAVLAAGGWRYGLGELVYPSPGVMLHADVDPQDGERITAHIFGGHQDQVVHQLGSTGAGSSLVQKLLPILAPIVLSYVAKQMGAKGGAAGGGVLGTILSSILAGAAQGTGGSSRSQTSGGIGDVLGDLLGGLLGGGRKR